MAGVSGDATAANYVIRWLTFVRSVAPCVPFTPIVDYVSYQSRHQDIEHVKKLAQELHSCVVLLLVATGVPAQVHGAAAAGSEIEHDRTYLAGVQAEFKAVGVEARAELGYGDPVTEICRWVDDHGCDLVAMNTHRHRLIADVLLGTTASRVQHNISVPVLHLRARSAT